MDSIVFAILCAAAVVVFVVWIQVEAMKLIKNGRRKGRSRSARRRL